MIFYIDTVEQKSITSSILWKSRFKVLTDSTKIICDKYPPLSLKHKELKEYPSYWQFIFKNHSLWYINWRINYPLTCLS